MAPSKSDSGWFASSDQRVGGLSPFDSLIGAATGGFGETGSERLMLEALAQINSDAQVIVVRFRVRA